MSLGAILARAAGPQKRSVDTTCFRCTPDAHAANSSRRLGLLPTGRDHVREYLQRYRLHFSNRLFITQSFRHTMGLRGHPHGLSRDSNHRVIATVERIRFGVFLHPWPSSANKT